MRKTFTPYQRNTIAYSQEWKCTMCKTLLPASFQIDHIIPLRDKGTNSYDNLQALCGTCHSQKSAFENSSAAFLAYLQKREDATGKSKYWTPEWAFYTSLCNTKRKP